MNKNNNNLIKNSPKIINCKKKKLKGKKLKTGKPKKSILNVKNGSIIIIINNYNKCNITQP